jgi:glycosyltransferase involved in cell wall biosynthesis
MKLISVVMPVLNAEAWLAESIASILSQTHRELELIVVDDGSEDASREIAAEAARSDSRVRPIALERRPDSTSSGRAANAGIAVAAGIYIARMDADDLSLPHRLEHQLAFLEQRGLDGCGGLAEVFGERERHYWYPESGEGVERELLFRVGILHPTLLARAELMRRHPYSESASHEDFEWQVRVSAAGAKLGNIQEVVLRHRSHSEQAHVRHHKLFLYDLRKYRFRHLMRLFPDTRPHEYQIFAAIAEQGPITDPEELGQAAVWLARFASLAEEASVTAMEKRWHRICERAELPADAPIRHRFAEALEARTR